MTQAAVAGGGAFDPASGLGPRLRQVREERGLSARELARRVGCSASLISQIERGVSAPSVGVLYALATELGASLDHLFGVGPGPGAVTGPVAGSLAGSVAGSLAGSVAGSVAGGLPDGHGLVQHAASRAVIDLASGVRWERLTPRSDGRTDFLEVIYQPDGHSTDERRALRHDGYEYGLILSGTLQANVGFDRLELGPGDSIAFDSSIPHEYWNRTDRDVRAVWVVVHSEPGRA
jgi:DNA-binding XRE family transcriptional regulator/quercetin dioxygenase-like cupin family protein